MLGAAARAIGTLRAVYLVDGDERSLPLVAAALLRGAAMHAAREGRRPAPTGAAAVGARAAARPLPLGGLLLRGRLALGEDLRGGSAAVAAAHERDAGRLAD